MNKRIYVMITAMILGLFVFRSCGGPGKMAKNPENVTYKVTPEVLERVGNKVNLTADATVAPKYFQKKAVVVLFPEVKYDGGSKMLEPLIVVGEKGKDLGYTVISKKNGGSASYKSSFDYVPAMESSEMNVNMFVMSIKDFQKIGNPKSYSDYTAVKKPDHTVKLADGVVITSSRIQNNEQPALAPHGYEKITKVSKSAYYYYSVGSSNYSASFGDNKNATAKKAIEDLKEFIKLGWAIDNITIDGWASPDGEIKFNNRLSEQRALVVKRIWEKDKVFGKTPPNIITKGNGEDWEGYSSSIQNSSFPDKTAAMAVITDYSSSDKDGRQKAINVLTRKHPTMNPTILDPLRRAIITVTCLEPKFTDEELKNFAILDPSKLEEQGVMYASSLDKIHEVACCVLKEAEMLYAATLYTNDLDKQLAVYKNVMQQFPQSAAAYNNAASIALLQGNNEQATQWLKKAESLDSNAPQAQNNLGILASREGNLSEAMTCYNKAKSLPEAQYNIGLTEIANGNYTQAQGMLNNNTCTYGLALAQLQNKKTDEAINTLNCCERKTADVYYLSAVAYARKGDKTNLATNLKDAIAANPSFKATSQKDREFIKFFKDPTFLDALK
jgi:outer membrane protein OmpA-like peptidoglycan-associated protein/Flp pilus assembly protein TadD